MAGNGDKGEVPIVGARHNENAFSRTLTLTINLTSEPPSED